MSILQITVLKGPRNGEVLVCKLGSELQIGRVLKGNDCTLRDPGISQQHLRFKFDSQASRWFVVDLDSSNGTFLNGTKIQALAPVSVSDHDVISIGEVTKLGVRIEPLVLLDENKEENGDANAKEVSCLARINIGRCSQERVVTNDESEVLVPVRGGKNNAQVNWTRVLAEEEGLENASDPDFDPELKHKAVQKAKVRGRRRKNAKNNSNSILKEKMKENGDSVLFSCVLSETPDQSRGVQLKRNPRRGNTSKALKELDMNCVVEVGIAEKGVRLKRGERRKEKEAIIKEDEMHDKSDKLLLDDDSCDSDCVIISDEGKGYKATIRGNSSIVTEKKEEDDIGEKEGLRVKHSECGDPIENMTVAQWFDSMFIFLPKAIHDETEEIISKLKEKARKFDEFVDAV